MNVTHGDNELLTTCSSSELSQGETIIKVSHYNKFRHIINENQVWMSETDISSDSNYHMACPKAKIVSLFNNIILNFGWCKLSNS